MRNFEKILYVSASVNIVHSSNKIWIVSLVPVDVELLRSQTIRWLKKEYREKFNEDLEWEFSLDWGCSEKVCMDKLYDMPLMYHLLTKFYGYRICDVPIRMKCLKEELKFSMNLSDDQETELISEPFFYRKKKGKGEELERCGKQEINRKDYIIYEPFSYYIKIKTTKTIDEGCYHIHISSHIRIWEERAIIKDHCTNYLKFKEAMSVFVFRDSRYYDIKKKAYQQLELRRADSEEGFKCNDTSDRYYLEMENIHLREALMQEQAVRTLPDGGIVLVTSKKQTPIVQKGAGLPERDEIFHRIAECLPELTPRALQDEIKRNAVGKTIEYKKIRSEEYSLSTPITDSAKYSKDGLLCPLCYSKVKITIAVSNETVKKECMDLLSVLLRLHLPTENVLQNGVRVEVVAIDNTFCKEKESKEIECQCKDEMMHRFQNESKDVLQLALIDLIDYRAEKYKSVSKNDPKNFIRITLKTLGVVTQFIDCHSVEAKNPAEILQNTAFRGKLQNALLDLLSAGGFYDPLLYKDKSIDLGQGDCLLGIGKVSDKNSGAIYCMTMISNGETRAKLYRGTNEWLTLRDIYGKLTKKFLVDVNTKFIKRNTTKDGLTQWFVQNINELSENYQRVICFLDASLREVLTNIQNLNLLDCFHKWHLLEPQKVLFIRVNHESEVPPAHVVTEKKGALNRSSGIFQSDACGNVFYIVHKRGDITEPKVEKTKLSYPDVRFPKQRVLEIVVVTSDNEKLKEYAILSRELLGFALTSVSDVSDPLPLFVMRHLTNYIVAENSEK